MKITGRYEKMCRLCGKDFTTLIEKQTVCTKKCSKTIGNQGVSNVGSMNKAYKTSVETRDKNKKKLESRLLTTNRYSKLRKRVKECKDKGFSYVMPKDKYFEIIKKNCYYCNKVTWGVDTNVGLDRIDNDKEYLESDVVSCCIRCNISRNNMYTCEEFKMLMDSDRYIKALDLINKRQKVERTLEEFADAIIEQYTKKDSPM